MEAHLFRATRGDHEGIPSEEVLLSEAIGLSSIRAPFLAWLGRGTSATSDL